MLMSGILNSTSGYVLKVAFIVCQMKSNKNTLTRRCNLRKKGEKQEYSYIPNKSSQTLHLSLTVNQSDIYCQANIYATFSFLFIAILRL